MRRTWKVVAALAGTAALFFVVLSLVSAGLNPFSVPRKDCSPTQTPADSASAKSSGPVNLAVLADNTDAIVTATATGVTPGPGNDDCTIALTEVEVVWQLPGKQVGSRFPERVPDVPPSLPVSNEFQNTGEITPGSEVIVWLQHTDDKPFDLAWEAAMLVDGQTGWPLPQIGAFDTHVRELRRLLRAEGNAAGRDGRLAAQIDHVRAAATDSGRYDSTP